MSPNQNSKNPDGVVLISRHRCEDTVAAGDSCRLKEDAACVSSGCNARYEESGSGSRLEEDAAGAALYILLGATATGVIVSWLTTADWAAFI